MCIVDYIGYFFKTGYNRFVIVAYKNAYCVAVSGRFVSIGDLMIVRFYGKFFFVYGKYSVFRLKRIVKRRKLAYINTNLIFAYFCKLCIISCKLSRAADICRFKSFAIYITADFITIGRGGVAIGDLMGVRLYGKFLLRYGKVFGGIATFGKRVVGVGNLGGGGVGSGVFNLGNFGGSRRSLRFVGKRFSKIPSMGVPSVVFAVAVILFM